MVERIREILSVRQLSPTQFADAIGVARPIVSHILSGRNKPSLEVVQKVIAAFPDLSLPWLLSGNGPMVTTVPSPQPASQAPVATREPVKAPDKALTQRIDSETTPPVTVETADARRPLAASAQARTVNQTEAFADPLPATSGHPLAEPPAAPPQAPSQNSVAAIAAPLTAGVAVPPTAQAKAAEPMLQAFAEPDKAIRRIVIFYHDGTFSDFRPEPNRG